MKISRTAFAGTILVYSVSLLILTTGPGQAAPPVQWNPERIDVTIGSGQGPTEPMNVTFETTRRTLSNRMRLKQ